MPGLVEIKIGINLQLNRKMLKRQQVSMVFNGSEFIVDSITNLIIWWLELIFRSAGFGWCQTNIILYREKLMNKITDLSGRFLCMQLKEKF